MVRVQLAVAGILACPTSSSACGDDAADGVPAASAGGTGQGGSGGRLVGGAGGEGSRGAAGGAGRSGSGSAAGAGGRSGGGGSAAPNDGGTSGTGTDAAPAPQAAGTDAGSTTGVRDPGSEGDGDFTIGPDYTRSADLTDKGAPKGRSFTFTMDSNDSEIFRGEDTTLLSQHRHPFTR